MELSRMVTWCIWAGKKVASIPRNTPIGNFCVAQQGYSKFLNPKKNSI